MKSISRQQSVFIIAALAVVHFVLSFVVVMSHLACETRTNCAGAWSSAFGEILGLPLGIVSHLVKWLGHEPNDLVQHVPGGFFVLLIVNSILAALITWSIFAKILRLRARDRGCLHNVR
ncbi:hypothetical protein [Xanthomonas sp. NCPPB 2632]|uniref:hypothetical protein n=1 Tax=Xanthomonas sp. NCPPB 2632 TaxID=3240912 RepID=UPI0035113EED